MTTATKTRARTTDPITSQLASDPTLGSKDSQKASMLRAFAQVRAGLTDEEAAARAGLLTVGFWKRAADLRNDGFIEWSPKYRVGSQGRLVGVSQITSAGRNALKGIK